MNESRPPDALDLRLDAGLRRRFAVPDSLAGLPGRALPRPERRLVPWLALAVVAAGLLALLLLRGEQTGEQAAGQRVAEVPPRPVLEAETPFCRLIGPLSDGEPEPGALHQPDLARLYRDMDACQRETSAAACGEGDNLAERLSAAYGQTLELRPEAAGRLHGPFGSDEWPTGTIVTGPNEGLTSVLVADRDATVACCVRMNLPESSGLHLFTWKVGEVVLTEITPHAEPQLLAYFE